MFLTEFLGEFVILSLLQKGEKSIEFKIYFKFMDTSPKAQYDKGFVILSIAKIYILIFIEFF